MASVRRLRLLAIRQEGIGVDQNDVPQERRPWHPLTPTEVARLFAAAAFPWWIAGGYAIEAAVGRPTRPHRDIDVLLLRRDQHGVREVLRGWDCWVADPPGTLRPWSVGETLPAHAHDIWCRYDPDDVWRLQLMLDDADGETWRFRRDATVTRPLESLGWLDAAGVPYLAPDIQILYKARGLRPRDERDFAAALPILDPSQRHWLRTAIARTLGANHPWLPTLIDEDSPPGPLSSGA